MAWLILIFAGLLEVVWASLLPATRGFTRLIPSLGFLVALSGSMVLLSLAVRTIPLGTAYAIWVGIGAVGAALVGMLVYRNPTSPAQMGALAVLVMGIVAVKLTSPS